MFLEDIVLRGYIRLLPLLLLISCGTKQVEYPDNVFFYSQFPQEKELKGEIIELDSIFFRYPFRVRVEGDKVIVMDLHGIDYYANCNQESFAMLALKLDGHFVMLSFLLME